jgi:phosphatidylserine/phosphatidylglycerophosphate/cardiolipin synthase-like enzyme
VSRLLSLTFLTAVLAVASPDRGMVEPTLAGVRVSYGPSPQTAAADLAALATARRSIDIAAFVLTDRDIVAALSAAARRGVAVRIYLDRDEVDRAGGRVADDLAALAAVPNVAIRTKARRSEAMHLKSYAIDRKLLRTGSANFSWSGERFQDNDVVLLDSAPLAVSFTHMFEAMWARPDNEGFAR